MSVRCIVTLCLISIFAFSQNAFAENEAFLCISEIPGGTADARNPSCIDIKSLSVDFSVDATYNIGSGGTSGAPLVSPFSIVKSYDVATVLLSAAVVKGQQFPEAVIRFFEKCDQCQTPESPFLVYTLKDVIVTRHNVSYFEGGAATSEIVDLSFRRISICSIDTEQGGGGWGGACDGQFSWNLRTNSAE